MLLLSDVGASCTCNKHTQKLVIIWQVGFIEYAQEECERLGERVKSGGRDAVDAIFFC